MREFDTRRDDLPTLRAAFDARLEGASHQAEEIARHLIGDVRARGDAALLDFTRSRDWPEADSIAVPQADIDAATARVRETPLWPVLELAAARITRFHELHRRNSWIDTGRPGEMLGQILRPLARVGVYVPGGTAALSSTLLMAAIPARVAGVREVVVTTPPGRDGRVADAILAAATLARVDAVYRIGGASAIGALAYGTETIARVDKIVGPGNVYVNSAKRLVFGSVGIDMLAGPSEVLVLADEHADPARVAADILAQTEHDTLSSGCVVSPSAALLKRVKEEIARQATADPRGEIALTALERQGFLVQTRTLEEAAAVASLYAPEHLHLDVRDPYALLDRIENAGAILIGTHASAPIGDYMAGPSHTLPTAGSARFSSPLNVDDFVKKTSLIYLSEAAARPLADAAVVFATAEGLPLHARAAAPAETRAD